MYIEGGKIMFGAWQSLQYAAAILLWLLAVIKVPPQKS